MGRAVLGFMGCNGGVGMGRYRDRRGGRCDGERQNSAAPRTGKQVKTSQPTHESLHSPKQIIPSDMTWAATQAMRAIWKNPYLTITTVSFLSFESQTVDRCARFGGSRDARKLLLNFVKMLASPRGNDDLDQRGCDVATLCWVAQKGCVTSALSVD
jgi:hypothetical protein